MQQSLMQQGVELMYFGMGSVFVFLTLLVILTTIMSALVRRFVKPESPATPAPAARGTAHQDSHLLAVISEAIKQHRSR